MTKPVPDSEFHRVICSLNDQYNLGILKPVHSPGRGRKHPRSHDEACDIYERLEVIHKQGHTLPELLGRFHRKAQDVSQAWVPKPRADPDVLPELSAPHSAQSAKERAALRRCLLDELDATPPRPTKRLSDDRFDPTPHRPAVRVKVTSSIGKEIDALPVRSTTTAATKRLFNDQRNSLSDLCGHHDANSFTYSSVNTSRATLNSSLFSSQGRENTPATSQGTEYTNSRTGKRTSSVLSQFLSDEDVPSGTGLSESPPPVRDEEVSDGNRTIRAASLDFVAGPASTEDRGVIPRSWSQSTGGYSSDFTFEDHKNLGRVLQEQSLRKTWRKFALLVFLTCD